MALNVLAAQVDALTKKNAELAAENANLTKEVKALRGKLERLREENMKEPNDDGDDLLPREKKDGVREDTPPVPVKEVVCRWYDKCNLYKANPTRDGVDPGCGANVHPPKPRGVIPCKFGKRCRNRNTTCEYMH